MSNGTGLTDIWREELAPNKYLDAYWLARIGFASAAAVSEIKHKDPAEARRLLEEQLRAYLRSPCVEPGEAEILRRAMK